ncbi:MAG: response regulator transcription factor [Alphaproteobacteria bacterium]
MRIHTENTTSFIHNLTTAISKDHKSLEAWHCLHIGHNEENIAGCRTAIISQIKKTHTDIDCDLVHCADNDVLFISRDLQDAQLYAIADEFINAASLSEGTTSGCTFYDMSTDWKNVRELLLTKTDASRPALQKANTHNFGETAALEAIFAEAKKLRKARMPLHIMVVEDDPLTRRITASAFKENYAIITAANAHDAVANYLLHAPDIVFLDIGLPDASGFDVLHQIMASDKDAYVVMFSSNSYLDNVTTALASGASGFIAKPFKKEKMRQYIRNGALHHRKQSM